MKIISMAFALLLLIPGVGKPCRRKSANRASRRWKALGKPSWMPANGLSEAQWNFKPAPDRWSIAECAEHIGVTETFILNLITEQALKGPAEPEKRALVQGKDNSLMTMAVDRPPEFKTPEAIQPTRAWATTVGVTRNMLGIPAAPHQSVTTPHTAPADPPL